MLSLELVVFDLDLTLWECGAAVWCDCLSPPFRQDTERVLDRHGSQIRLYDDVGRILSELEQLELPVGIASRTHQPKWARELLDLLDINHRFAFAEIYPESKLSHFASLRDDSGVDFANMLFFDDEARNIREVSQLGVTCIPVAAGMTWSLFQSGLQRFD